VQVQIEPIIGMSTTETLDIPDEEFRENALKYYSDTYKKGIIFGLNYLEAIPNFEEVENYLEISGELDFLKLWKNIFLGYGEVKDLTKYLENKKNSERVDIFSGYIYHCFYKNKSESQENMINEIKKFILNIKDNKEYRLTTTDTYYFKI
ncbi:MAG: hypothetical protein ACRC6B_08470, partial [Fusobacteriaceae bacterium]